VWAASLARIRGRFDESAEYLDRGAETEPPSAYTGIAAGFRLLDRAFAGDVDAVRRLLDEAMPKMPVHPQPGWGPLSLLVGAAAAAVMVGETRVVAELYDRIKAVPAVLDASWFDGMIMERVVAMAATALERWDEAEHHFDAARKVALETEDNFDVPSIDLWQGRMLLARGNTGDVDRARALITGARERFAEVGATWYVQMADDALREYALAT
jgi:hypothetical protein